MKAIQINQKDNILHYDGTNVLGYQYSANLVITLKLEEDGIFKNLVKTVTVNLPKKKKTISCTVDWSQNPAIITLPQEIFEQEGIVYIALFGADDTGFVINTNPLAFQVDKSNSVVTVSCDNDILIEQKIMDVMGQWYDTHVKPDFDSLQQEFVHHKDNVSKQIVDFDTQLQDIKTMAENGDFDGSAILQGMVDPSSDIGKDGDIYINVSDLSWHFFYKNNGVWEDKGSIKGSDGEGNVLVGDTLESAQAKSLFLKTITQSQAIAETRGIAVNEFDVRIPMNQVRISDETNSQGLDEYVSKRLVKGPNEYILNEFGAIQLPESTVDPKTLIYEGNYACGGCKPGTSPMDGVGCHITVRTLTQDNRTLIIDYRHNGTSWRNDMVNGVWSGWKLIAGEVLLWSGNYSGGVTIAMAYDLSMFKRLMIMGSGVNAICIEVSVSDKSMRPSSAFNYSNGLRLLTYDGDRDTIIYIVTGTIPENQTVTAIYGRP